MVKPTGREENGIWNHYLYYWGSRKQEKACVAQPSAHRRGSVGLQCQPSLSSSPAPPSLGMGVEWGGAPSFENISLLPSHPASSQTPLLCSPYLLPRGIFLKHSPDCWSHPKAAVVFTLCRVEPGPLPGCTIHPHLESPFTPFPTPLSPALPQHMHHLFSMLQPP